MHTFKTILMSSRFSLGIFVFTLACGLLDTSFASSLNPLPKGLYQKRNQERNIPSDVVDLIKKYITAEGSPNEEPAARALAYHRRYQRPDTSIDHDLITEDLNKFRANQT